MINHFLQTIQHLRHYEEIILYNDVIFIAELQHEAVIYLTEEYRNESVSYPFETPVFDPSAALWAARIVYTASQLMLYRKNEVSDIGMLLPAYNKGIHPSSILSADLLLRFLPHIIIHLKAIDPEDELIAVLENHLHTWHFSGVGYKLPVHKLSFDTIVSNACLHQLYIDRVIENKHLSLASHPLLMAGVKASMGIFGGVYWQEFTQQVNAEHEHN